MILLLFLLNLISLMKHWVRNDEKQATKSPRKWWKTLDNRSIRIKLIQLMKSYGCECRAGKDRTINRIQPNAYWNIRFGANHFSSTDAKINVNVGNSIHVCSIAHPNSKKKKTKNYLKLRNVEIVETNTSLTYRFPQMSIEPHHV